MDWLGIVLTVVVAMLLVLVEHWLPWGKMLGRKLPRLWAYAMGVAAMLIPLTVLVLVWDADGVVIAGWMVSVVMWLVAVFSGLAVMVAWWVDSWLDLRMDLNAAEGERAVISEALRGIEEVLDG
jgi:hypothetical protein